MSYSNKHPHLIGGSCQEAAAFNASIFMFTILTLGGGALWLVAKSI